MKDYSVDQVHNINLWRKNEETVLLLRLKEIVSKVCPTYSFGGWRKSNGANFSLKAIINVLVCDVLEHV